LGKVKKKKKNCFFFLKIFTDSAQLLLLALLCVDQFISVVWTKRHKEVSVKGVFSPQNIYGNLISLFIF